VVIDWHKRDRYGRIVGKIMVDWTDANLAMVVAGFAWWYREYGGDQSRVDRGRYEAAESRARRQRIGLWSDPRPIAPWAWRDRGTTAVPVTPSPGACPCDSGRVCTGPKGGRFCVRESGSKQYFPRD
jgi:hypothetical protein